MYLFYIQPGNIVLHLMMPACRQLYDIEALWTCGPEFDSQVKDQTDDMYSFELQDIDFSDFIMDTQSDTHNDTSKEIQNR